MNQDVMQGKWKEIKGEIRKMWGDVTGDELEQTKGDMTSISGLIQQRYGAKKEDVKEKLSGIVARFQDKAETAKKDMKASVEKASHSMKENLKTKN